MSNANLNSYFGQSDFQKFFEQTMSDSIGTFEFLLESESYKNLIKIQGKLLKSVLETYKSVGFNESQAFEILSKQIQSGAYQVKW